MLCRAPVVTIALAVLPDVCSALLPARYGQWQRTVERMLVDGALHDTGTLRRHVAERFARSASRGTRPGRHETDDWPLLFSINRRTNGITMNLIT